MEAMSEEVRSLKLKILQLTMENEAMKKVLRDFVMDNYCCICDAEWTGKETHAPGCVAAPN